MTPYEEAMKVSVEEEAEDVRVTKVVRVSVGREPVAGLPWVLLDGPVEPGAVPNGP